MYTKETIMPKLDVGNGLLTVLSPVFTLQKEPISMLSHPPVEDMNVSS